MTPQPATDGSKTLADLEFTDLFLTASHQWVKGLEGHSGPVHVPDGLRDQTDKLLERCAAQSESSDQAAPEFAIEFQDRKYRVSRIQTRGDLDDTINIPGDFSDVYVLRKVMNFVPDMDWIGMPEAIMNWACASNELRQGLIVFSGPMGSGKTTTGSALIREWLLRNGGIGVTIEDPPELPLEGEWPESNQADASNGYVPTTPEEPEQALCFQTEPQPDYQSSIKQMMRYGSPNIIYLGELRDPQAVSEALRASINGHLIVTTIHAAGIRATIDRLITLGSQRDRDSARSLLAEGLAGIVHQELDTAARTLSSIRILFTKGPSISRKEHNAIKERIRNEKADQLRSVVEQQVDQAQERWG